MFCFVFFLNSTLKNITVWGAKRKLAELHRTAIFLFLSRCMPHAFNFAIWVRPWGSENTSHLLNCFLYRSTVINKPSKPIHYLWLLPVWATCSRPVWQPPLQEQQTEVSADQLQHDWPDLCQQTSEDECYWLVVSTRVWTAPTRPSVAPPFLHTRFVEEKKIRTKLFTRRSCLKKRKKMWLFSTGSSNIWIETRWMPPAHHVLPFTNPGATECSMRLMLTLRMTHFAVLTTVLAQPGMDLNNDHPLPGSCKGWLAGWTRTWPTSERHRHTEPHWHICIAPVVKEKSMPWVMLQLVPGRRHPGQTITQLSVVISFHINAHYLFMQMDTV